MDSRTLETIIKEDNKLRRFIEINLDVLSHMAHIEHGEINCPLKDGKLIVGRKKIVLEG